MRRRAVIYCTTDRIAVGQTSGLKSVLYVTIIFMLLGYVKDVSKDFMLVVV